MSTENKTKAGLPLILTVLAGIAGIGLGLTALAAPVGVWLQAWDFRQGFSILRSAARSSRLAMFLWCFLSVCMSLYRQ